MCGIFAYSGPRNVTEVLIKGLKALEYRGYDSAGVAFFNKNKISRFRVCGGVSELETQMPVTLKKFSKSSTSKNQQDLYLGIGHTRWATHGAPNKKNAHPHQANFIYVVHNGVIENTDEIKQIIRFKKLLSDTDTELIPHLIHHFSQQCDLLQSVIKSVKCIKGSYAVVAIDERQPKEMIAFKSGPPLVLCQGDNEFFISSDPQAVDKKISHIIFLEDEEILHLKNNNFKIFNFKGEKVFRKWTHFVKAKTNSDKGQHPHFMIKEILEQPDCLKRLIFKHIDKNKKQVLLKLLKGSEKEFNTLIKKVTEINILACGSSYYSALFAKYFLEQLSSIRVNVEIASEFIYRQPFISKQALQLFISQSGETADILTALKQIQQRGLKSLSLCNVESSSLNRKTDFCLSMEAGPEVAVASTKSFSASLMSLAFFSFYFSKIKGYQDFDFLKSVKDQITGNSQTEEQNQQTGENQTEGQNQQAKKDQQANKNQTEGQNKDKYLSKKQDLLKQEQEFSQHCLALPAFVEKALKTDQFFLEIMEKLKSFKAFFYLGRGPYYPIALEGALKLKEVAYLHAEAYPSGEMKHGPLAMIDKNTAVIALLPPEGVLYKKSLISLKETRSRGACIISIGGCKEDKELKKLSHYLLTLPKSHKLLHPALCLIPLQMMAYYISRSYGYNADRPRNLAKSVTVE